MSDRQTLSMPSFDDDMNDFAPRQTASKATVKPVTTSTPGAGQGDAMGAAPRLADTRRAVDAVSQFPSREASRDGQLNLKGPQHVLDRFKAMCKADRRAYYDMLEILMDNFEEGAR